MRSYIKKTIIILLILVLMVCSLSGCGSGCPSGENPGRLKIVTTIFPEYDWLMNLLGDNPADIEVILLTDNGTDMHSFQPNVEDIMNISSCDLLIYVGGESDKWVDDVLKGTAGHSPRVLNLLDELGETAMEEELSEGMQAEPGEEEEEEAEYDEHVWLSLWNAGFFCYRINDVLAELDPENAEYYGANFNAYADKLMTLHTEYQETVDEAPVKTLLFADRFPFRYMTVMYGLKYYAAFPGCSAESEASFETVTFLANKLDELGLRSVITVDGSDQKLAETIINASASKDQKILTMDSMQSVTREEIEGGADYLSIMKENLSVLKEALR